MNITKKQQKLNPTTIAKNIKEIEVKIQWLKKKAQKIAVQVGKLEGTIRNYQDRCPHPLTQQDDEGCYNYCTTCGATIGSDGEMIPPERVHYDEELFK